MDSFFTSYTKQGYHTSKNIIPSMTEDRCTHDHSHMFIKTYVVGELMCLLTLILW